MGFLKVGDESSQVVAQSTGGQKQNPGPVNGFKAVGNGRRAVPVAVW
jgi:hypothetical protein